MLDLRLDARLAARRERRALARRGRELAALEAERERERATGEAKRGAALEELFPHRVGPEWGRFEAQAVEDVELVPGEDRPLEGTWITLPDEGHIYVVTAALEFVDSLGRPAYGAAWLYRRDRVTSRGVVLSGYGRVTRTWTATLSYGVRLEARKLPIAPARGDRTVLARATGTRLQLVGPLDAQPV